MMPATELELSQTLFALLGGASFLGSFITASLGVGGGVFVLVVMAMVLPPVVLIPVHGVVQMASNLGRLGVLVRFMRLPVVLFFTLGAILGTAASGAVFFSLPEKVLQIAVLLGALLMTWLPTTASPKVSHTKTIFLGAITSFLGVFVGATGLLVAPSLKQMFKRRQTVVATHAALMSVQHGLKLILFGSVGFNFGPYALLLVVMILAGLFGTLVGRYFVLERLSERNFTFLFKGFMTVLVIVAAVRYFV